MTTLFLMVSCQKEEDQEKCVENIDLDCVCATYVDPVCGCNGVTYSNHCFAGCAGIEVVKNGPCD